MWIIHPYDSSRAITMATFFSFPVSLLQCNGSGIRSDPKLLAGSGSGISILDPDSNLDRGFEFGFGQPKRTWYFKLTKMFKIIFIPKLGTVLGMYLMYFEKIRWWNWKSLVQYLWPRLCFTNSTDKSFYKLRIQILRYRIPHLLVVTENSFGSTIGLDWLQRLSFAF